MLTIVVPVYRNEESIPDLLVTLEALRLRLVSSLQVVLVVDGSPDRSYAILQSELPKQKFPSQLLLLSRNYGSFAAIRAGLAATDSDNYAILAADLQEPPELILDMERELNTGQFDVVIGTREGRSDPFFDRILSELFWRLYRKLIVQEMPRGGVDVFACNREFRNQLLALGESRSSLVAQVFWLGFRRHLVPYTRLSRRKGKSAWTLYKKINYLMDSVFAFTDLPITILINAGAGVAMISGLISILVIWAKLEDRVPVPGYAMIILSVIFLGSTILFGLGIVGSYAWRAYENSKARPLSITMRREQFGERN